MRSDKFWAGLKTSTRNSLKRHYKALGCHPETLEEHYHPWLLSVKELIRIPGIGPSSIAEIARLTEKYCV